MQIHHSTQQAMLNQWLYHTLQYLEPNTKSRGVVTLVSDVTITSLVAITITGFFVYLGKSTDHP